jgi:hypothetical protein
MHQILAPPTAPPAHLSVLILKHSASVLQVLMTFRGLSQGNRADASLYKGANSLARGSTRQDTVRHHGGTKKPAPKWYKRLMRPLHSRGELSLVLLIFELHGRKKVQNNASVSPKLEKNHVVFSRTIANDYSSSGSIFRRLNYV